MWCNSIPLCRLLRVVWFQCRTQHDMWCNTTYGTADLPDEKFQCRTQHDMWCNHTGLNGAEIGISFQCRTQHDMWCNSVAHSPCPTQGERAFWKVVDFFTVFPLWGGIFTEKSRCQSTHSLVRRGAAPKWKMATVECGFAASPSHFPLFCTFYIISNTMEFFKHNTYCAHSFFTSLGFGRTARLRKRLSFPSMLICAMFLSHSGC